MDKEQVESQLTEQVIIFTERELVEGTYFHHRGLRMSDALNSASPRDPRYLPLADVRVTNLQTGEELFQSRFLLVAHSKIVFMMPRPEIVSSPVVRRWMENPAT